MAPPKEPAFFSNMQLVSVRSPARQQMAPPSCQAQLLRNRQFDRVSRPPHTSIAPPLESVELFPWKTQSVRVGCPPLPRSAPPDFAVEPFWQTHLAIDR